MEFWILKHIVIFIVKFAVLFWAGSNELSLLVGPVTSDLSDWMKVLSVKAWLRINCLGPKARLWERTGETGKAGLGLGCGSTFRSRVFDCSQIWLFNCTFEKHSNDCSACEPFVCLCCVSESGLWHPSLPSTGGPSLRRAGRPQGVY